MIKKYQLYRATHKKCQLKEYKLPPSHAYSTGGTHRIALFLDDTEVFDNIIIDDDLYEILVKRTMIIPEECIMDILYRMKPEMFEE